MKPTVKTVHSQPSWIIRTDEVELAVTKLGGHMAPVSFYRDTSSPVQPYYISPWQGEKRKIAEPVLAPLRGDFFCMPFGANNRYRSETHDVHGESAGAPWTLVGAERKNGATTLTLSMDTKVRPGKITKHLRLIDGHNVVYSQHVLEGYSGRMCLGHHATLAAPEEDGAMRISTSPMQYGLTNPTVFSDPADGEYQALAVNQRFTDLAKVPRDSVDRKYADCTSFPARIGYDDLLAVFTRQRKVKPSWTAAVVDSQEYMWFSIRDPFVLPTTVMWMSNRGRHHEPWLGRNRCIGLEDVCAYFAEGLSMSARSNPVNAEQIPTAMTLSKAQPTVINYIQGVLRVPRGFVRLKGIRPGAGEVTFISVTGKRITAPVDCGFLWAGPLMGLGD